jgi:hypothetical protein
MKNAVFWDVKPRGSGKNLRFGGTYRLHHQNGKNKRARNNVGSARELLVSANVVPSSPTLFTLMMEAIRSSEMSVLTRATRSHIPGDGILLGLSCHCNWFLRRVFLCMSCLLLPNKYPAHHTIFKISECYISVNAPRSSTHGRCLLLTLDE